MSLLVHQPVICPVLVGRAPLVAALERLLEQAVAGKGQTALLAGEAGIGKSRVIAEMQARATARSIVTLQGQCFEADRVVPYAPVIDLARSLLVTQSPADLVRDFGPAAPLLLAVAPEFAALLPAFSTMATIDAEQGKRRLFEALAQTVVRVSAAGPVLLVVEDLHWCDDTSLEFLLYLARCSLGWPILLLLSYRDDEVHPSLVHFLTGLDRERLAMELHLGRLAAGDLEAMLRAIFTGSGAPPADLGRLLYMLTEGNPFFIEEMLRALLVTGHLTAANGEWQFRAPAVWRVPRSVQATVQRRAEHLSAAALRVLTLAAVVGQRFDFSLLQALGRLDEAELLGCLAELIAAQLVVEVSAEQFSFRHALTRQAIASRLLLRERRGLHQKIVERLESTTTDMAAARLADLAWHAFEAEDWPRTLRYARGAGERAWALHALHEAIQHFTRALQAADYLSIAAPPELLRARGLVFETVGDFERARSDHEAALHVARTSGDLRTEWQALLDLGASWAAHDYSKSGAYLRQAIDLARVLDDPICLAQGLNRLGNWLANTGRPAEGIQVHHDALRLFEGAENHHGIASTLDLLGMANVLYGDWNAAVERYGQAITLFRELGDARGLATSLAGRGPFAGPPLSETTFVALWPRAACERDLSEAAELMSQLDWPAGRAFLGIGASPTLAYFGDFGAALARAQETLQIAMEIGHQQWLAGAHSILGEIYVLMLAPDQAVKHLTTALTLAQAVGSSWWIGLSAADLAQAYLLKRQVARAEAVLEAVGDLTSPSREPRTVAERRVVWVWGELALRRDKPMEALRIAEALMASAPGPSREQPIPVLLLLQGQALLALGRQAEAKRALDEAKRGALQRDVRPFIWQVHAALGRLHERRRERTQARDAFALARDAVQTLATTIDDDTLRDAFLAAAAVRLPTARPPTALRGEKQRYSGLTRREREVASHVAAGRSNREIAALLFVGEGTIATHVSSMLTKLDFTSRSQIAAWATQRGLSQPQ
jgi:DNA-binding CsgD family transcriptional regulator